MPGTTEKENVDSKFLLILLAAKRARQIQGGAKPLIHTLARKPTRIALEELKAGVLPYEVLHLPGAEDSSKEPAAAPKGKR